MNEHDNAPGEPQQPSSGAQSGETSNILNDGIFSIKVSEDMTIRNSLRRGLVEAQGKNLDRIPLFVSWPNWLEDGIVCLYAKDLHRVLHDTVQQTALAIKNEFDIDGMDDTPAPFEEAPAAGPTTQPSMSEPLEAAAPEPYSTGEAEPVMEYVQDATEAQVPTTAPKKTAPSSHQDIADQLFNDLKNGKQD